MAIFKSHKAQFYNTRYMIIDWNLTLIRRSTNCISTTFSLSIVCLLVKLGLGKIRGLLLKLKIFKFFFK
jgi:hypothetical protein